MWSDSRSLPLSHRECPGEDPVSDAQNHLIELLPCKERSRLLALCALMELVFADALCAPGDRTRHVYFPVDGFVSLLTQMVLRNELSRYVYVLMRQLAASAACLRLHETGPRLARWPLMRQDRAHAESLRRRRACRKIVRVEGVVP